MLLLMPASSQDDLNGFSGWIMHTEACWHAESDSAGIPRLHFRQAMPLGQGLAFAYTCMGGGAASSTHVSCLLCL